MIGRGIATRIALAALIAAGAGLLILAIGVLAALGAWLWTWYQGRSATAAGAAGAAGAAAMSTQKRLRSNG